MEQQDETSSLKTLEENIRRFQSKTAPKPEPEQPQGMQAALRIGLELAIGVLVGAGVGIFLDKWFGTSPVFCILCLLLGAAGGFLTIYRTMTAMDKETGTTVAPPAPEDDEDD